MSISVFPPKAKLPTIKSGRTTVGVGVAVSVGDASGSGVGDGVAVSAIVSVAVGGGCAVLLGVASAEAAS